MIDDPVHILDSNLTEEALDTADGKLFITEEISAHWRVSSKWASSLATLGYLWLGILIIGAFWVFSLSFTRHLEWVPFLFILPMGFWLYLFSQRLYRYSVKIKDAANYSEWDAMDAAFANLRSSYSLYGGFTLLITVLFVIMILFFIGKSMLSSF